MIGREKSRHCQTWLERRSSLNENLQQAELNCEIYKSWKKRLENPSQFLSEQPYELKSLDVALKITGVKKNTLGKFVVTVNLEAIWFEFWMKGA